MKNEILLNNKKGIMKKLFKMLILIGIIILSITSCKKDLSNQPNCLETQTFDTLFIVSMSSNSIDTVIKDTVTYECHWNGIPENISAITATPKNEKYETVTYEINSGGLYSYVHHVTIYYTKIYNDSCN